MKGFCAKCGKEEEMERRIVNLDELFVPANVCTKCGEEWIDEKDYKDAYTQHLEQKNTLTLHRKLIKMGDNLALKIPREVERTFSLKAKEEVEVFTTDELIIIKPESA